MRAVLAMFRVKASGDFSAAVGGGTSGPKASEAPATRHQKDSIRLGLRSRLAKDPHTTSSALHLRAVEDALESTPRVAVFGREPFRGVLIRRGVAQCQVATRLASW